uniref:Uncharacterized protein n=1 Tax=Peromyscus maniculatus bairdii TaxID=230844 RepID=A0A8C8UQQ9_PERMB
VFTDQWGALKFSEESIKGRRGFSALAYLGSASEFKVLRYPTPPIISGT